jgi:prepilin-type N-terminal cleavage/methylation domain-containing protein
VIGARLRLLRRDSGTTLMEVLVSIVVVGILASAVTVTVTELTHDTMLTKQRDYATEQAQVTLDRASRLLRAATIGANANSMFLYAGDDHATFYSDLAQPNGPALVDLDVTGSPADATLVQTVTPADAGSDYTYNTGPAATGRDGTDIMTTAGPVFTYYDASGNLLSTPMTTVAQLVAIARVKITVVDQDPGLPSQPVTDSTMVELRNVEYS